MKWTFQENGKIYTVTKEKKMTCDCPVGGGCRHIEQINGREGDNVKKPEEYNGYKIGDKVTYVGEFEGSKDYFPLGVEAEIVDFIPSPNYEWVGRLDFKDNAKKDSLTTKYNFPLKPEYIQKKHLFEIKTNKTQDEVREQLWKTLME